jgi:hypothetical protein
MKSHVLVTIGVCMFAFAGMASAFEYEPAVPLTIGANVGNLSVDNVHVGLSGRKVSIDSTIENPGTTSVKNGYFAYTPIFNRMGVGEENYAKDFKEFRVLINGKPMALSVEHRGFFLGKDVTPLLHRVGLDSLPNENADAGKLKALSHELGFPIQTGLEWQGFVSYSWAPVFAPVSSSTMEISYFALPQFSLEKVGGDQFAQLISQHCGDAESLTQSVKLRHPNVDYVLIERYDIPISFVGQKTALVEVSQPSTNWAGVHPFASFACGLQRARVPQTSISGKIDSSPNGTLSVLIVSIPA